MSEEEKINQYKKSNLDIQNDNENIEEIMEVLPPIAVIEAHSTTPEILDLIKNTRTQVKKIIKNEDDRLLIIVGPCSIHNEESALDYAAKLKPLINKYKDQLCILMRVYFEKPRTTIGWKGLISDPYINNTFKINEGLKIARKLLIDINALGVPSAGEFLDLISPQYIADLMSWGAIGARTTESQTHRELASGLSCSIGFKNATNGNTKIAIDAMQSSSNKHVFIGVNKLGQVNVFKTKGNDSTHLILRGGDSLTNYDEKSVEKICEDLEKRNFLPSVMIDCSHANSQKDYRRQSIVAKDIASQISKGSYKINGVMIESNLVEGSQEVIEGKELIYGQSITDSCINFETTMELLEMLSLAVIERRNKNK